jgi:phosphatidylserine/phosphatidylglycerophosphate/cardiolipin synthase-like enzyme
MFLDNEEIAGLSRIKIIEKAEKELLISYYIFEDDKIGLLALDLMLLKKEMNPDIKIKLLLDAHANKVDKSLLYFLEQHGIEIKEFHSVPKLFVPLKKISIKKFFNSINNLNYRMHDKLIIADNIEIIGGGRNIEKSYYGLSDKNFHDFDFYLTSTNLTTKVRNYFLHMWNSNHVKRITYNKGYRAGEHYDKMVNKLKNIRKYTLYNKEKYLKLSKNLSPKIKGIQFKKANFLSSFNSITGKFEPEFLSTSLFNLAIKIKKSMLIETPYFLPTKRMLELLKYLQKKNVKVEFITNSYCSSDAIPVVAAYDNEKENLSHIGVDLYEYKGPDYLHVKSAVFDNKIALLGSYNMDPRSAYLNTELVFVIEDENVAKKLKSIIYNDKKNCVKVKWDEDNFSKGYYNCTKSGINIFIYTFFRAFSHLPIFYYQF